MYVWNLYPSRTICIAEINIIKFKQLSNEVRILEFNMITQALSCMYLGFGVFTFYKWHYNNYSSFKKYTYIHIYARMNTSSLNIFSTRHIIYSISEKVCLEKDIQLYWMSKISLHLQNHKRAQNRSRMFYNSWSFSTFCNFYSSFLVVVFSFCFVFFSILQQNTSRSRQTMCNHALLCNSIKQKWIATTSSQTHAGPSYVLSHQDWKLIKYGPDPAKHLSTCFTLNM